MLGYQLKHYDNAEVNLFSVQEGKTGFLLCGGAKALGHHETSMHGGSTLEGQH